MIIAVEADASPDTALNMSRVDGAAEPDSVFFLS